MRQRRRRKYPYYKVQTYDGTSLAWRDEKPAFGTVQEATSFVEGRAESGRFRIIVVEERCRYVLGEESD